MPEVPQSASSVQSSAAKANTPHRRAPAVPPGDGSAKQSGPTRDASDGGEDGSTADPDISSPGAESAASAASRFSSAVRQGWSSLTERPNDAKTISEILAAGPAPVHIHHNYAATGTLGQLFGLLGVTALGSYTWGWRDGCVYGLSLENRLVKSTLSCALQPLSTLIHTPGAIIRTGTTLAGLLGDSAFGAAKTISRAVLRSMWGGRQPTRTRTASMSASASDRRSRSQSKVWGRGGGRNKVNGKWSPSESRSSKGTGWTGWLRKERVPPPDEKTSSEEEETLEEDPKSKSWSLFGSHAAKPPRRGRSHTRRGAGKTTQRTRAGQGQTKQTSTASPWPVLSVRARGA